VGNELFGRAVENFFNVENLYEKKLKPISEMKCGFKRASTPLPCSANNCITRGYQQDGWYLEPNKALKWKVYILSIR
jgi:hypothetical protein